MVSHLVRPLRYAFGILFLFAYIFPAAADNGKTTEISKDVQKFYQTTNHAPLWFDDGALTAQGKAVIATIQRSWTHGLRPENYHAAALASVEIYDPATAELLISDAAYRYANDLNGVDAGANNAGLHPSYWEKTIAADILLSSLATAPDAATVFHQLLPEDPLYDRLRGALIAMATTPVIVPGHFSLTGAAWLKPGDRHPAVARLKKRLGLTAEVEEADNILYDAALLQAVEAFQYRHGLATDGIVGPATVAALNKSPQDYYDQIIVTMERLRRVPRNRPGRYFEVNIAAAVLDAYQQGESAFSMPVVTGRKTRKTKSFIVDITGVRLNPNWTVPQTIKREDYLPILQDDPNYFLTKDLTLYEGYGPDARIIDPLAVNWQAVNPSEMRGIRMVQPPGNGNALGRIRLLMPNRYDIFMHDTNHPSLFSKHDRHFSSGCIRLSRPVDAARFVMQGTSQWSEAKMERTLAGRTTTDFAAAQPLKAYVLYRTVWTDANGEIIFGPDPYGWDAQLARAMKHKGLSPVAADHPLYLASNAAP